MSNQQVTNEAVVKRCVEFGLVSFPEPYELPHRDERSLNIPLSVMKRPERVTWKWIGQMCGIAPNTAYMVYEGFRPCSPQVVAVSKVVEKFGRPDKKADRDNRLKKAVKKMILAGKTCRQVSEKLRISYQRVWYWAMQVPSFRRKTALRRIRRGNLTGRYVFPPLRDRRKKTP